MSERLLDPRGLQWPAEFQDALAAAGALLDTYLQRAVAGIGPPAGLPKVDDVSAALQLEELLRDGAPTTPVERLTTLLSKYLEGTTKLHHPHFLAHQVARPHWSSAIADLVNGVANNGMAVYEMGPPAVALERTCVAFLAQQVGWPDGGGVLVHGGSIANLTALQAARAKIAPESWEHGTPRDLVVLAPPTSHYCVARAVSLLGLGSQAIRSLPADKLGVVQADRVAGTLDSVQREGKRPMALVANACQTATGRFDPLRPLGELCRERGVWFHVDGAHGASAAMSARHRALVDGIELADSVVWDAHKMLSTSVLCAAALFRDATAPERAFNQDASYLSTTIDPDHPDLYRRAIECTKNGLGLKLFAVLATLGAERIGEHISALFERTDRFAVMLDEAEDFEAGHRPQSNIQCFRYTGESDAADRDALQERLRVELLERFYLSGTTLNGRRYLRIALMNPATEDRHLAEMLCAIRECARKACQEHD